ncbi:MAG: F0F1 ATP synthase subunit A [Caldilineaceae bacterium]
MTLSPDTIVFWRWGAVTLNATIVYTWLVMALLVVIAYGATRNLSAGPVVSRWQTILETVVTLIGEQIEQIMGRKPDPYLPFIGTLFLYIAVANILSILPGYRAPTGSLATTAVLAMAVFVAIPAFGIAQQGLRCYLKLYIQPTVFMLPFTIIGELSRTLALAVRLFGNMMSGDLIVAILLTIVPFFFPVIMQLFGLLVGQIQAYIFAVLATVYIASAVRVETTKEASQTHAKRGHEAEY